MSAPGPLGRGELQSRAVKGALWTGVHTFVSLPLAFLVNILVARVLGVGDYGRLTYLSTVIGIASAIAGLGVTTALIQFGAKAHATGNPAEVRRLLSASQGFRLLISGPIVALIILTFVQVDWWLMAIALAFGVGLPALLGNAAPALTIENRTDRSAQITMVNNGIVQVAVIAAVLTLGTPDAVWSARVIAHGVLLALPLAIISSHYRSAVLRPTFPWRLPKAFWAFAIPAGLAGVIGALVSTRTEVVFLDWFADEVAMGLFGLAYGLAGHVYAPAQAFIGPLVPAVSALSTVDQGSVRRAFLRTTRAGSSIGGLLIATALPALAILVPVIYGDDFRRASDLLVIIGVGGAVAFIAAPHQAFLMARLGGRRLLWVNIVSLVANLALALILIPAIGALGAAIACSAAMIIQALQISLGEARSLKVSPRVLFRSLGAMSFGIGVASGLWVASRQLVISEVPLAIGIAALGGALYVGGIKALRTGLTKGDAQAICGALPARIVVVARFVLSLLQGSRATG